MTAGVDAGGSSGRTDTGAPPPFVRSMSFLIQDRHCSHGVALPVAGTGPGVCQTLCRDSSRTVPGPSRRRVARRAGDAPGRRDRFGERARELLPPSTRRHLLADRPAVAVSAQHRAHARRTDRRPTAHAGGGQTPPIDRPGHREPVRGDPPPPRQASRNGVISTTTRWPTRTRGRANPQFTAVEPSEESQAQHAVGRTSADGDVHRSGDRRGAAGQAERDRAARDVTGPPPRWVTLVE